MVAELCEFSYKAGYDQAVIDDVRLLDDKEKMLDLALHIVSYLLNEKRRLVEELAQAGVVRKKGEKNG